MDNYKAVFSIGNKFTAKINPIEKVKAIFEIDLNDYTIKSPVSIDNVKAITTLKIDMPPSFFDLTDVVNSNKYDKYVVTYDATTNRIVLSNPDEVLSSSVTEPDVNRVDYTLPSTFEDKLDVDLDNRIDLDAGEF